MARTSSKASVGLKHGFRSGLEKAISDQLEAAGVPFEYEEKVLTYTKPESKHRYTPDFVLPNDIIVETKGRFLTADRQKHLLVKAQRPDADIRFVFSNSKTKISKTSATTYGDWCTKHGFLFADKRIPKAWLNESKT